MPLRPNIRLGLYGLSTLYVDYTYVLRHEDGILAAVIGSEYYRFLPYMIRSLHHLIRRYLVQGYNLFDQQILSHTTIGH